jgi:hypothetical protein
MNLLASSPALIFNQAFKLLPRPWPGRAAREIVVRSRRLALLLREEAGRPALFGMFDEMLETL